MNVSSTVISLYKDINRVVHRFREKHEPNVIVLAMDITTMLGYYEVHPTADILHPRLKLIIEDDITFLRPNLTLSVTTDTRERTFLLVQEDKNTADNGMKMHAALPLLVGGAVAAYKANEYWLHEEHAIIYGITLLGTMPTFYKIPINDEILKRVELGTTTNEITNTIEWYNPIAQGPPTIGDVIAISTSNDDFVLYLKSYEAMRRLLSQEIAQIGME